MRTLPFLFLAWLRHFGQRFSLAVLALVMLLASAAWQSASAVQIVYVAGDAAAGGNGNSWNSPLKDLQTALDRVNPTAADPVEIWIKRGVYKPTTDTNRGAAFVLKSYVTLRGGFSGFEASANLRIKAPGNNTVLSGDIGTSETTGIHAATALDNLSAIEPVDVTSAGSKDNSYNVLRATSVSSVTLDQLVITGGMASDAAIDQAFVESMVQMSGDTGYMVDLQSGATGGGLFSLNSSLNITDCSFSRNHSKGVGGAIATRGGSIAISGTSFIRNLSAFAGGAVSLQDTGSSVRGNVLYGNNAAHVAGALWVQSSVGSSTIRGYLNQLLISLNSSTDVARKMANLPASIDLKNPLSYLKLASSTFTIGKTVAEYFLKSTATLATTGSSIGSTAVSQSVKMLGAELGGAVTSMGSVYTGVTLVFAAVDIGVQLALILGADPNDSFIQGWTQVSAFFNTYFTPFGLAKLLINAILGEPPIDHKAIAARIRLDDYAANHNKAAMQTFVDNRFELNYAAGMGGAVVILRANVNLLRSYFVNNESIMGGGAAAVFGYNTVNIENCGFIGNRSSLGHSALSAGSRTVLRCINDAFVDNHSTSPKGRAVSVETGAEAFIGNSVLWNNTAGENRTVGADLFVARRQDLDTTTEETIVPGPIPITQRSTSVQQAHDKAGDARGAFVGTCSIRSCDIQSLGTLETGTAIFPGSGVEAPNGFQTQDGVPNIGEGITPSSVASSSNFSRDPIFTTGVLTHPLSPLINAGGERVTLTLSYFDDLDLAGRMRVGQGRIDIGPIESDGTLSTGTILYVNGSRTTTGAGDGLSWATAYKTIPEALAQPLSPGSQIWVAFGSYYVTSSTNRSATLTLPPGVALIGGFKPGDTQLSQSSPVAQATIISGDIGTVGFGDNVATLLTGTTVLKRGPLESIREFERLAALPRVIQGLVFVDAEGGPALKLISPAIIKSCHISHNRGPDRAVSIRIADANYQAAVQVIDSTFANNTGGAIDSMAFNISVVGSTFQGNTAPLGAGLYLHGPSNTRYGTARIERSVFTGNKATEGRGGAIHAEAKNLTIAHCVIANNTATPAIGDTSDLGGAGLWIPYEASSTSRSSLQFLITNSIFYGNRLTGSFVETTLERQQIGISSYPAYLKVPVPVMTNNNIEGLNEFAKLPTAAANIDYDPMFTSDYRLQPGSMLLNRGTTYNSSNNAAPIGDASDIGAYENATVVTARAEVPISFNAVSLTEAGTVYSITLPSGTSGRSSFVWQVKRPGGNYVTVSNDEYTSDSATGTLVLTNPPHHWNGSLYRVQFTDTDGLRSISATATATIRPSFLYVKSGGFGKQDGSSWANAFASPTQALQIAAADTQVFVAAGDYTMAPVGVQPGVKFYGGFAGTETLASQRIAGTNETILRCSSPSSFMINIGGSAANRSLIDGFTIKGAPNSFNQNCIAVGDAKLTIENVRFSFAGVPQRAIHAIRGDLLISNSQFTDGTASMVLVQSGNVVVNRSTFADNGLSRSGQATGAIETDGASNVTITDSSFTNNYGFKSGAITHLRNGRYASIGGVLKIDRCRFIGNSGGSAGAVYVENPGDNSIRNSLFAKNRSIYLPSQTIGSGGAISVYHNGALSVIQSTLVDNSADRQGGAIDGTYLDGGGAIAVTNSIIWGNQGGNPLNRVTSIINSHIQGAAFDPLFHSNSSDFALSAASPLIDKAGADSSFSGASDLAGNVRIQHGAADLGAIESATAAATPLYVRTKPSDQSFFVERAASFAVDASLGSNTGTTPVEWQYLNGSTWTSVSGLSGWTVTLANGISTLAHPALTQSMDGTKFRVIFTNAPGVEIPFTLTVKPRLVLFVDGRIDPSGNGNSWATAFKTLAQAFAAATADTDIWVAAGDYAQANVSAPFGSRILAGFTGNETDASQRDPIANPIRIGSPLADRSLVTDDIATFTPPIFLNQGQQGRWQVDRGDGNGFVNLTADQWHTLTLVNGVPGLAILGNPAFVDFRYRIVVSEDGSDVLSSVPAKVTVIARPVVYVNATVSGGARNGTNWENAFSDLTAALAAYPAFADFKIAEGTYVRPANSSFLLRRSLTLTGGYVAGTEVRDPAAHRTILQSPGSNHSFDTTLMTNASRGAIDALSIIDGFVFRNAGLGIDVTSSSPIIRNCRFEGLVSAISVTNGNPAVENSIFVDQYDTAITTKGTTLLTVSGSRFERNGVGLNGRTTVQGSSILVGQYGIQGANNTQTKARITDCIFNENLAQYNEGAIVASNDASLEVTRSAFTKNIGGIVGSTGSTVTIRQSLFAKNQKGALRTYGKLDLNYSTVTGNDNVAAAVNSSGNVTIRNSILWGNTQSGKGGKEVYQFSLYEGSKTLSRNIIEGLSVLTGNGLLPFDPRFVDAANNDYRLAPISPAIDAGFASDLLNGETDLANASRLSGAAPDLGAYESTATSSPEFGFALPASLSGPVGSTLNIGYTAPLGSNVVWQYSSDGIAWSSINPTSGSASSPPGAGTSVQSLSQLTLANVQQPLNGISIRMVLIVSGISYTSQPVPVTIVPFENLYVDSSVATSGDGRTWSTAFKTLTEAIDSADQVHRKIEIATGTYQAPAASFKIAGFEVRGGWPTQGNGARNPSANPTILTGLPSGTGSRAEIVVSITPGGLIPALLDGVIVENGGTGIVITNIVPNLSNLIVRGHTNTGLVVNATSYYTSGGRIENSIFENNSGIEGGGIRVSGGGPTFDRVIVRGNTATRGGGVSISSPGTHFSSPLITGNVAEVGGALHVSGKANLDQATIANNYARDGAGVFTNSTVQLRNSIVWGNRDTQGGTDTQLSGNNNIRISYSSTRNTIVEETQLTAGILRSDPIFVSPITASSTPSTAGNYQLRDLSPAINAGDNAVVADVNFDIAGNPRLIGNVDLGAYESGLLSNNPLLVINQPNHLTFSRSGTSNTFTASAIGAESVQWEYFYEGQWLTLIGVEGFTGADSGTLTVAALRPELNGIRIRAAFTSGTSTVYSAERTLTVYSPRLYVNAARSSSGVENGLTWATAFRTLTAAIALPYDSEGTEIWLAAGTYSPSPSFTLRPGTSLYGGFFGNETLLTERDPAANVTSFTSTGAAPIVSIPFVGGGVSVPVRIDGITLRDASANGIDYMANFPLNLDRVKFINLGTALYQRSGRATITRSSFLSNQSAIYSRVSALIVRQSEFRGNGGTNGGPVVDIPLGGQSQTFENCLFTGNTTTPIYTRGSTTLRHLTIANNLGGTALNAENVTVHNSIIWGNRTAGSAIIPAQTQGYVYGSGNIVELADSTEPIFLAAVPAEFAPSITGNYQLNGTSRTIEAGNNAESNLISTDLAGAPRLHGSRVDPGAYEYQSDPYFITSPVNAVATIGTAVQFKISATAAVESIEWEESSEGTAWTPISNSAAYFGTTTDTLTVTGDATFAGKRYRARIQFPDGPELVSNAARYDFISLNSATTAGFATPAIFTATASGDVISYQWQLSLNGGGFGNISNDEDHSGATTSVLAVAGNSTFTNRTYRVLVSYNGSPTTASNSRAYTYAELATNPSGGTPRNGTLNYGPAQLGFTLPGIDASSISNASIAAFTQFSGRAGLGAPVINGDAIAFDFLRNLHAGERVSITTTSALTANGITARPQVWEITNGVRSGNGVFDQASIINNSPANSTAFALADLDSDATASIDAIVAGPSGNQVYLNNGRAEFTAAGAAFGKANATSIALGSLTSSGKSDAVITNADGSIEIWSNNGSGIFVLVQTIADASANSLALGDLDADGDLDLFVARTSGNRIYRNNGSGNFTPISGDFGSGTGLSVALGDIDNDGKLDALVGSASTTSLWINQGNARFNQVSFPTIAAERIALRDFNGDGFLDIALTHANSPTAILLNQDHANFFTAAYIGGGTASLATGDTNGDRIADVVLTDATGALRTWTGNDFVRTENQPPLAFGDRIELADLDNDGALDLFAFDSSGKPATSIYRVVSTLTSEDTATPLTATGFTRESGNEITQIKIASFPTIGALLNGNTPINIGDVLTSEQAAALIYQPGTDLYGFDSFSYTTSTDGTNFTTEPVSYWLIVEPQADEIVPVSESIIVAQGGSTTTLVGGATSVLANDINADPGTAVVASIVGRPAHGTLTLNADGTFAYQHNDSETRSDRFTYRAKNTTSQRFADIAVNIEITNINDAPTSIDFSNGSTLYTGQPAGSIAGSLKDTDPDPEDTDLLTFSVVSNNQFEMVGNVLKTTGPLDATAGLTRTVLIRATDPGGLSFEKSIQLSLTPPPAALAAQFNTNEDVAVLTPLSGENGIGALSYEIVDAPANGTLTHNGTSFVYRPNLNFNGNDSFTFRASDGVVTSSPATTTIAVAPVNDTPSLASALLPDTTDDTAVSVTLSGFDIDGDPLSYWIETQGTIGTAVINGSTLTYTPTRDALLDPSYDWVIVYAYDPSGARSQTQSIRVLVTPINDAPVLTISEPVRTEILKDTPITFVATIRDFDSSGTTLELSTPPTNGNVSISSDGTIAYTNHPGFTGSDSFSVIASDGDLSSAPVTLSVSIIDPAPVANPTSVTGDQRTTLRNFLSGYDRQGDSLTINITSGPSHGSISLNPFFVPGFALSNYEVVYTPNADFFGTDSLTFTMTDAGGNVSAPATATFIVKEVNEAPAALPFAKSQSGLLPTMDIVLAATDAEGAPLTYRIVTPPVNGTLAGSGPAFTYTPATSPFEGSDSFTYLVNDGVQDSAPATATLSFTNDHPAPVANPDGAVVYRGLSVEIPVLANDSDPWGNPFFVSAVTQGQHGTVTRGGAGTTGTVTYRHNGGPGDADVFTYTLSNFDVTIEQSVIINIRDRTILVTNNASTGEGTLRDAVDIVNRYASTPAADNTLPIWNIQLIPKDDGYALDTVGESDASLGDSALLIQGKVTIEGFFANAATTIRRASSASAMRVFHIAPTAEVTLKNLTVANGSAHHGGGIYNEGKLTLENVNFEENAATPFDDAPGLGGGLFNRNTTSTLNNVRFIANTAGDAAGLYNLGDGSSASIIANQASFSGQSPTTDFRSATLNGGTAEIIAEDLTAETPTAPWFGPIADTTINRRFSAILPVRLDAGQALAFIPDFTTNNRRTITIGGSGNDRTITAQFDNSVPDGIQPIDVTASGNGVTFKRQFDLILDSASDRAPILRDDDIAIAPYQSIPITALALANDEDPDGTPLSYINIVTGPDTGEIVYLAGEPHYYAYTSDSTLTYTVPGALAPATIRFKVQPLNAEVTSTEDSGAGSLREGIDLSNAYFRQSWTLQPSVSNEPFIEISTIGNANSEIGDSAFLITGDVTIDGANLPDFVLRRSESAPAMRLFHVAARAKLTLKNLIVENGISLFGGAIYNEGTVILEKVTLQNHIASATATNPGLGGAIYNAGGTVTATDSNVLANAAQSTADPILPGLGGAIYTRNGSVNLIRTSLLENTAGDGGAFFAEGNAGDASAYFTDSRIGNSFAASDLSSTTAANGNVNFHNRNTSISRITGPWVSPISDVYMATQDRLKFLVNDQLPDLSLNAFSESQAIVPNSGLVISGTGEARQLDVTGDHSGVSQLRIVASSGNVHFHEIFLVAADTGVITNPIVYPDVVEIFPGQTTDVDVLANDEDPYDLNLTITSVTSPTHGTAVITPDGKKVTYTHTGAGDPGTDEFFYTVSNGFGGTASTGTQIRFKPTTRTVTDRNQFAAALAEAEANPGPEWIITINAGENQTWETNQYVNDGEYYTGYHIRTNVSIDASNSPGFRLNAPMGGWSGPPTRLFSVYPNASLTLKNVRLTGGVVQSFNTGGRGGVVRNRGTFIADHVTFESNNATTGNAYGGALFNEGGTAIITDSAFINNTATGNTSMGGAIASRNGSLTLNRVTFSGNSATIANDVYIFGDEGTATVRVTNTNVPSYATETFNGGLLDIIGLVNSAPTFAGYAFSTTYETSANLSLTKLLSKATDADGDTITLTNIGATTHGGTVTLQSGSLFYTPAAGFSGTETFPITLSDSRDATVTATITVTVQASSSNGGMGMNSPQLTPMAGGKMSLTYQAIPGRIYRVQRSTDLANWTTIATLTAGPTGRMEFIDDNPPSGSGFYRLKSQ